MRIREYTACIYANIPLWYTLLIFRCGRGMVMVRSRCGRGSVVVRSMNARGTVEVRSWCDRGTLEVRSRYSSLSDAVLHFNFLSGVYVMYNYQYYICHNYF